MVTETEVEPPDPTAIVKPAVDPFLDCLGKDFYNINLPGGIKPVIEAALLGSIAPFIKMADLAKKLIPPTPEILEDVKLLLDPLGLIIDAWSVPGLPEIPLEKFGVTIPGETIPGFDPTGLIDLVIGLIEIPIKLVVDLATGMLEGKLPVPPTPKIVVDLTTEIFDEIFPPDLDLTDFINCFVTSFVDVVAAVLPVP
jgi:hypothetical protein